MAQQLEQQIIFGPAGEEEGRPIPNQGNWTEEEYFQSFPFRGYELSDGFVEVLPMPTEEYQDIASFLYRALYEFSSSRDLGKVQFMGLRVRVHAQKIREPDVVFMLRENEDRRTNKNWQGADLAMEIVSDDKPSRDWKTKRAEYAQAGIPEYWIVDPRDRTVTVLTLPKGESEYAEAGRYGEGATAASVLLDGFAVNVDDLFSAK